MSVNPRELSRTSPIESLRPESDWTVSPWVYSLDWLRGLAALSVVVNHAVKTWQPHVSSSFLAIFSDWLGVWGVTLFFVLSGFCIHLPQARALAANGAYLVDWRRFAFRRAKRLLPTHYVALILSALVGLCIQTDLISAPTIGSFTAHVFMVHVWKSSYFNSINAVFWSIAIEVHFYLCYPVYLFLAKRFGSLWTVAFLAVGGLATYFLFSAMLTGDARFVGQHLFLVSWWQWALGAAIAEIYSHGLAKTWTVTLTAPYAPSVWALLSFAIALKDLTIGGLHVRFWLIPVLCAGLLGSLVVRQTRHVPFLSNAGIYSYSIYLIHPVAYALLLATTAFGEVPAILKVPAAIVFSIFASWIFFLLVERHFLSVKQRTAEPLTGAVLNNKEAQT